MRSRSRLGFTTLLLCALPVCSEKVMPVSVSTGNYTLTTGPLVLSVGAGDGGRVTSLKHQGKEMFFTKVAGSLLWGSTFWPSPQVYWTAACRSAGTKNCFPPPVAIDPNTYTATLWTSDTSVTLTGGADSYTKLRIRKTFSAHSEDTSFTAKYHLINTSSAAISWGPWETTRFPSGGWVFWPTGEGQKTGNAAMVQRMRDTLGTTWFPYDSSKAITSDPKTFADAGAGGWLARVDKDRVVFIKKFTDTPPAKRAPEGENEIELYIQKDLLELEVQGPYGSIPANDSTAWEVRWLVRKLPDNIAIGPNAALLDFVQKAVSNPATAIQPGSKDSKVGIHITKVNGQVRLHLERPMDLTVTLSTAQGRVLSTLWSGPLTQGSHDWVMPLSRSGKAWWVVVRDSNQGILAKQPLIWNE
jgi:Domain of unknown function (DUF4380)